MLGFKFKNFEKILKNFNAIFVKEKSECLMEFILIASAQSQLFIVKYMDTAFISCDVVCTSV